MAAFSLTPKSHHHFKLTGKPKMIINYILFILIVSLLQGTNHLPSYLAKIKYLSHTVNDSCKPSWFWRTRSDLVPHHIDGSVLGPDANSWCSRNFHSKPTTKEWEHTQHTGTGGLRLFSDHRKKSKQTNKNLKSLSNFSWSSYFVLQLIPQRGKHSSH